MIAAFWVAVHIFVGILGFLLGGGSVVALGQLGRGGCVLVCLCLVSGFVGLWMMAWGFSG